MAEFDSANTPRMTVELLSADDGSALVTIVRELDMKTISELEAAVEPILSGNPARLVVDVSGVSFADSSAIALWVRWANRIRQVELHEPSLLIRRVITRMGLAERLRMIP
ncbi:MAG: STAS domain-containing protein [Solirubrobacteraceae bacterium]